MTALGSQNKYKVIFIDWNGTLSASKFWGHLADEKHPKNGFFKKVEIALFNNLRLLLNPWMRGKVDSEYIMERIASDSGLDADVVMGEFIKSCKEMKFVSDEVFGLINQARGLGIKVVIATDNMDSFTRWTVPTLKLHEIFDDVLNSFELGALKNDFDDNGKSLFFSQYLNKNGIGKGESVLIDDSEDSENYIANYGIEYRRIKPVVGLVPELQDILSLHHH